MVEDKLRRAGGDALKTGPGPMAPTAPLPPHSCYRQAPPASEEILQAPEMPPFNDPTPLVSSFKEKVECATALGAWWRALS